MANTTQKDTDALTQITFSAIGAIDPMEEVDLHECALAHVGLSADPVTLDEGDIERAEREALMAMPLSLIERDVALVAHVKELVDEAFDVMLERDALGAIEVACAWRERVIARSEGSGWTSRDEVLTQALAQVIWRARVALATGDLPPSAPIYPSNRDHTWEVSSRAVDVLQLMEKAGKNWLV